MISGSGHACFVWSNIDRKLMNLFILFWLLQNPKDQEQQETRSPPLLIITCSRLRLDLSCLGIQGKKKEMKSPLRKLRGFGLPHNNKEGKDRRPPSWTSSPTPPRFPNSFQFLMWRGAGRECEPKSGGSLGSCGFAASFLLSVYTHFFAIFGHCWVR
jgi:hypothetical protein